MIRVLFFAVILLLPTHAFLEQLTNAELVYKYLSIDSIEAKLQRTNSRVDPVQAAALFRSKAIDILNEIYTPEELEHMANYYGSEIGQTIRSKGATLGGALSVAIEEIHAEIGTKIQPPPNE